MIPESWQPCTRFKILSSPLVFSVFLPYHKEKQDTIAPPQRKHGKAVWQCRTIDRVRYFGCWDRESLSSTKAKGPPSGNICT